MGGTSKKKNVVGSNWPCKCGCVSEICETVVSIYGIVLFSMEKSGKTRVALMTKDITAWT